MKSLHPIQLKQNYLIGIMLIILSLFLGYLSLNKMVDLKASSSSGFLTKYHPKKEDNSIELSYIRENGTAQLEPSLQAYIDKAYICMDIKDQMPVGIVSKITPEVNKIYCWARLINAKGEKIRYIWYLNDKVTFSEWQVITSSRFLTWCSYPIERNNKGYARVEIVTQTGRILARLEFQIISKSSQPKIKQL